MVDKATMMTFFCVETPMKARFIVGFSNGLHGILAEVHMYIRIIANFQGKRKREKSFENILCWQMPKSSLHLWYQSCLKDAEVATKH